MSLQALVLARTRSSPLQLHSAVFRLTSWAYLCYDTKKVSPSRVSVIGSAYTLCLGEDTQVAAAGLDVNVVGLTPRSKLDCLPCKAVGNTNGVRLKGPRQPPMLLEEVHAA